MLEFTGKGILPFPSPSKQGNKVKSENLKGRGGLACLPMSYQSRTFAWNANNAPVGRDAAATIRDAIEKSITRWYVNRRVGGRERRIPLNSIERVFGGNRKRKTVEGCLSRVRDLWRRGRIRGIWHIFFKCWKFRSGKCIRLGKFRTREYNFELGIFFIVSRSNRILFRI